MFDHLQEVEETYGELERQLADPDVLADGRRYQEIAKRHAELRDIVSTAHELRAIDSDLEAAREMLDEASADERDLARAEIATLEKRRARVERDLTTLLVPADPNDAKDVIMEIRAGAGGDEAALFAAELLRMYDRFAEAQGWATDILSSSAQGLGGMKEAIVEIKGRGAYSRLKHESGVHRVQRVPQTESQGRIHTSTATVAVLPAAEDVDIEIDEGDLRVDVYRSSGPGGQSVNTTDSAVRITHLPSGLVVSCQDEKSQHQNREKALRILRARLLQIEEERAQKERADARRGQIGTGDRSEKIRTYNFPDGRVTDHRIKHTSHDLDGVLDGKLEEFLAVLAEAEREARLAALDDGVER